MPAPRFDHEPLRFRQVHLDFHTPQHVTGVGADFDPERFVRTLKEAHVNSVTCFSRCHHGYIYHETKLPARHPHLDVNLLAEQIRACHAADIRVPIYITVGWDHLQATLHPEWIEIDEEGRQVGRKPLNPGQGWYKLDFASPYLEYVVEQTQEVLDLFGDEVDGLFFDIIFQQGVHSIWAQERFRKLGWSASDPQRCSEMRQLLVKDCVRRLADSVREKNGDCGIFFNSGHVGPSFRGMIQDFSHLEIESLPTGGWGYMHFPMTVRYARTLGKPYLGMTGRFSENWGHFHSYKPEAALEFECASMLAQGARCSVGDQLHPRGDLDQAAYDLIGAVYERVEAVEQWCTGGTSVAEIGVISAEGLAHSEERIDARNLGAARILIEGRHQFDFLDLSADLGSYRVVILPDAIPVSDEFAVKLTQFLGSGGAILASGSSGFNLPGLPGAIEGHLPFSPDFLRPLGGSVDYVMYERGVHIVPSPGAEILATISTPYFERDSDRFFGHYHSPVEQNSAMPGVVLQDRVAFFAHPIFTTYAAHSMLFHRDLVLATLERLLPDPLVRVQGPRGVQASVVCQEGRTVVHLLYYIPERRGLRFDIVEEGLVAPDVDLRLRGKFRSAYLAPSGATLQITESENYSCVSVPSFKGCQMVVFDHSHD